MVTMADFNRLEVLLHLLLDRSWRCFLCFGDVSEPDKFRIEP
jgi:hypothetical protein